MPEEPEWMWGVEVSDEGKYLLITVSKDCDPVNQFYYVDLSTVNLDTLTGMHKADIFQRCMYWIAKFGLGPLGNIPVIKLVDKFEAEYSYITNEGNVFYFKTNLNAPRFVSSSTNAINDVWQVTLSDCHE